ncbi:MAG: hypothetical protein ACREBO_04325 [Novosphingobium sp.]
MKPFTTLAIALFVAIGIVHLLRLMLGFEVVIAGWAVPLWASLIGAVIAGVLALMLAREARRS